VASSGMLRRVAIVRADVSEELSVSFIRVTRIGELGKMLSVNWQPTHAAKKRQLSQDLYGITSQKTAFFIVPAVTTSNLV
jgi:hypothetical protein